MPQNDDVFHGTQREEAYVYLNLFTSIIGTICSIITIILIRRVKSTTGHVYLVYLMSVYQLLYDITFFFSEVPVRYYISVTANLFQATCGVASSFVSNWIAFIAMYIVWYRRKVDVFANLKIIHITSFLPGFASALIYLVASVPKSKASEDLVNISIVYIYNNLRLFSIFLNFVFVLMILVRIYRFNGNPSSPQEIAIRTLARRMIYYPIIQAIGRSGYSWYEYAYGTNFGDEKVDTVEYSSMILAAIVTPAVSVGYMIIFLIMQPNAYKHFKALIFCQPIPVNDVAQSVPSFSSATTLRSDQQTDAHFDSRFEYTPEAEMELGHHVHTSAVPRFSFADWTRKSAGNREYQQTDLRDEDELFAVLDEDNDRDSQMSYRLSTSSVFRQFSQNSGRTSEAPLSRVPTINSTVQMSARNTENEIFVTENVLHKPLEPENRNI